MSTPYMGITLPIPAVTQAFGVAAIGQSWGELYNTAIGTALDAHDHTSGKGKQVPSAGISINADLSYGGFNLTSIRSARFSAQGSPLSGPTDTSCIYVSGVDFYVNDVSGNQIRLTSGGAIAGTPGSISGLVSPAAVSYTPGSKLFDFTSSSGVRANLYCGPLSVYDPQAAGNSVTLKTTVGLAGSYNLIFPSALPASTSLVSLDSSGNIGAAPLTLSATTVTGTTATTFGLVSGVADGASAVGFTFDTTNTLANATAKIASWKNGGSEKAFLDVNGDLSFSGPSVAKVKSTTSDKGLWLYGNLAAGTNDVDVLVTSISNKSAGYVFGVYKNNTNTPLQLIDYLGYTSFSGANPASSTGFSNTLTPSNIVKAWALLTCGAAGAVTVTGGFNVASASYSGSVLTMNFATALANTAYAVIVTPDDTIRAPVMPVTRSTGNVTFRLSDSGWVTSVNWASGCIIHVVVLGLQ